jgi:hypothetical protein
MAEEEVQTVEEETEQETAREPQKPINKIEQRINDLNSKVIKTAQERDEIKALNQQLSDDKVALERERDFHKDFSTLVARYPGATDYQEKILERVNAGYTVEDATVAVLNKEGKLLPPEPPKPGPAAGGSAPTGNLQKGEKSISEMTNEELRAALVEAEKRGDLGLT